MLYDVSAVVALNKEKIFNMRNQFLIELMRCEVIDFCRQNMDRSKRRSISQILRSATADFLMVWFGRNWNPDHQFEVK